MSTSEIVNDVDRYLALAGDDVPQIRALEILAEAAKDFAANDQQKKAASVAKLKIARHGGQALKRMAERGERATGGKPSQRARVSPPTLQDLGLTASRSSRWQAVANMTPASFGAREQAIWNADPDADLVAESARDAGSGDFEWFTPPEYIAAARVVMDGIDLDPASTAAANETVGATTFYTAEQDGLAQAWAGRVWMNPPYAKDLVSAFCEKLAEEFSQEHVTAACVLLNNTTETFWFQRLAEVAAAVCFPARRVKFWHPDKEEADSPKQGQAVFYLGDDPKAFCTEFVRFGFTAVVL